MTRGRLSVLSSSVSWAVEVCRSLELNKCSTPFLGQFRRIQGYMSAEVGSANSENGARTLSLASEAHFAA